MNNLLVRTYLEKIRSKDPLTCNHCGKAAEYAVRLGREVDLSDEELEQLSDAAFLHDIGKLKVPDNILRKPASLTKEEYELVKCHPDWGAEMLHEENEIEWHKTQVAEIIRHHHERFDGKGYPQGLSGERIPFLAQIVAIADAFDAMTSDRPYRTALPLRRAREILLEERGKQFHPLLVDRFIKAVAC